MDSYEQRYKKAMEIAKKYRGAHIMLTDDVLGEMFPELKESEDGKIRNALINGFNKLDKSAVWYNGITNGQILAWLEKQGEQKPDDKVEPKFKIGDTITDPTDSTFTFHINAIKDGKYMESDKEWVLIKEADSKYELVEQKPTWSKEDDEMLKSIEYHLDCDNSNIQCHLWLRDLKGRVQPKQEWNEEDKDMLEHCIGAINAADYYTFDDKIEMEKWLKSLKERVQPQPKQEWSEKDKIMVDAINKLMKDVESENNWNCLYNKDGLEITFDSIREWLKSLRPQNRWKPSEEQMIALRQVISGCSYDIEPLVEIEEYLKKLREE